MHYNENIRIHVKLRKYINIVLILLQRKGIFKRKFDGSSNFCCINLSISEVKLFFTFCFLLVVMVLQWTTFSLGIGRSKTRLPIIQRYALCMSGGLRQGLDCKQYRRDFEDHATPPALLIISYTLFSLLSYSNLPFLIQYRAVKHFVKRTAKRLSSRRSTMSSLRSLRSNL